MTDLGELCAPFRYSFPPNCINTIILKKGNEKGSESQNRLHDQKKKKTSHTEYSYASVDDEKDDKEMLINSSDLWKPFCIYRYSISNYVLVLMLSFLESQNKLYLCFYFYYALGHSVEIRWPEKDDGLTVKLKVKQSSSADWFGIGFSVGNMMVMLMLCISMRTHRHKNIIQILHNPVILSFFRVMGSMR